MFHRNANSIRLTTGEKIYLFFCYFVMIVFSASIVCALLYVFQVSLSGDADTSFRLLPHKFTLGNYIQVFKVGYITRPFLNSVFVTACRTALSVTLTVMVCYPLSRKELIGRKFWNLIIILPPFLDMGFIPSYLQMKQMGLLDSYWSLILPVAVTSFNVIIMRNFFEAIPISLIESARIDGCSEYRMLWNIIVPLSTASIATVALFYMVASWNTYFTVILYISDTTKFTLQVVLRELVVSGKLSATSGQLADDVNTTNLQYTAVTISIIPVMVVYPILQRYFMKGITLGAVKE